MKVKLTQNYNGSYRGETIEVDDLLGHALIGVEMAIPVEPPVSARVEKLLEISQPDENKAIVPEYQNPIDENKAVYTKYKRRK